MKPFVGALRDVAKRGNCGFGKIVHVICVPLTWMRDLISIPINLSLAPQTKAALDLIIGLIVSERWSAENTHFEFFEHRVRNLLVGKRLFIRSIFRVALALLGEHESLWRGLLDGINRQCLT